MTHAPATPPPHDPATAGAPPTPPATTRKPQQPTSTAARRLHTTRRRLTRPALATLAGLLLYTAFPPIGWWPLAPVAVAVLTLTVRGRRLRTSCGLGLLFSLGFLLPLLRFVSFVGADGWIVLSTAEAAILAVIAPATTLAWRLPAAPLWTGAAWVAQEALRGRAPFGGFPWGRLAFSQPDSPYTGLAALGGAPLVTFAVAATAALLATTAIHLHTQAPAWARRRHPHPTPSHPTPPHGARRPTLALTATAATAGALTLAGLAVPLPTAAQHGTLQVAAIQGDVPEAGGYHALGRAMQVTTNHVQGTENLAAAVRAGTTPQPDLVLWPENSSDLDPLTDPDAATALTHAATVARAPLLVGAVLDGPGDRHVRNAGLIWTTAGPTGDMYVKRHPVPFAEYLPGRALLEKLITRFADEMPNDFLAGTSHGALPVAGTTIGDVICFEVAYDGLVRDNVNRGAELLVIQTNNASFGRKGESEQQLAMSRLRAVEHGRATVQVSTSGQSAIIAPDGTILSQTGLYEPGVLTAQLPLRTTHTLATRLGIVPEMALTALAVIAMLGALLRSRRTTPHDHDTTPTGTDQKRRGVEATRVVVCVPTYNERDNLPDTARRLRTANPAVDLLVIDDASPDGTGDIADELAAADSHIHVLHRAGKSGLGSAYIAGFTWALQHGYDIIVEMDADGSHQPEQLPRLLDALTGADLAIGSRWIPGGTVHNWPRSRLVLSRGANAYVRAALGVPLRDATAGFRAYRADVLRARDLTLVASQGYCFQVDLAWRAWQSGFRVIEVPIDFVERERGASKMNRSIVAEGFWRVGWWALSSRRRGPAATRTPHTPSTTTIPAPAPPGDPAPTTSTPTPTDSTAETGPSATSTPAGRS
ncbi:apolipoprotein N-acyltransferase [Parafrankia irregularis]|uniref:Apolipoprotein N-acyltransferase n=1 Tax=Parafrankia irregularis TaxID=795642 RepID=A0A0S4QL51_9ACTN|nr:apolipoprotein N-acyltransferase [Parafrankia irregularis]CUU56379.1 apolipoprotein N-acyltransferase [Parafrankia irregularis]